MAKQRYVFPYIGGRYVFTMPPGYDGDVTYHCWGGGGGAGGESGQFQGGNGSAGAYTTGGFRVSPGDQIEVSVGGGGAEGREIRADTRLLQIGIQGVLQPRGGVNGGSYPGGAFGTVPGPSNEFPVYTDPYPFKTYGSWNTFQNLYAVWDGDINRTVDYDWDVYFPVTADYTVSMTVDNSGFLDLDGTEILRAANNFAGSPVTKIIRVEQGSHHIHIQATDRGVVAGVSATVTLPAVAAMGNPRATTPANNLVWSTRYGRNLELTDRVPIFYAPVVPFYQPQNPEYVWGNFGDTQRSLAFISASNTWTDEELAALNFSRDQVLTISDPMQISGIGYIAHFITSGYYTFTRGQNWTAARYNWSGNPDGKVAFTAGTATPSNWTQRYNAVESAPGWARRENIMGVWSIPVPPDNAMYVVGYSDQPTVTATPNGGSYDITWSVSSLRSQEYAGGVGGASRTNLLPSYNSPTTLNYYGGYGGQIGVGKVNGGGGGGGGASLITLQKGANGQPVPITPASIGLNGYWWQNISTALWYEDVGNTPSSNLTIENKDTVVPAVMPVRSIKCLNFVGTGFGRASCATAPYLNVAGLDGAGNPKEFTLEAWIYATGPGQHNPMGGILFYKEKEYEVARMRDGRIAVAIEWAQGQWSATPGSGWMITTATVPLNTATLVSTVVTKDDCLVYLNSVLAWQATVNGYPLNNGQLRYFVPRYRPPITGRFSIGQRAQSNQGFQGYIGDARLWNVARTAQQIAASVNGINLTGANSSYSLTGITVAAGGGGGGGATAGITGGNAFSSFATAATYPNTITAGAPGQGSYTASGGGGGGGGGNDGAAGGAVNLGGYQGSSRAAIGPFSPITVDFVMIGRGGNGNQGGGGAGSLLTGSLVMGPDNRIQVGGTSGDDGTSYIDNGKEILAAGPGGRGGYYNSPWAAKSGSGQNGGVLDESNTSTYGGSGGGAGTEQISTGTGGKAAKLKTAVKLVTEFTAAGGNQSGAPAYSAGGGGGAGGVGKNGAAGNSAATATDGRAGDGGLGKTVVLGGTKQSYTLGGGGGGAAGFARPGVNNAGLGEAGAGDGQGGTDSKVEYSTPGTYTFYVPRNVSSITMEAVGAGGGGGPGSGGGSVNTGGGGGSGGYLPSTSYEVKFNQKIDIIVGAGSLADGGETRIVINAKDEIPAQTIVLQGGRKGTNAPSGGVGGGGAGGNPNGNTGQNGGEFDGTFYYSGAGADSPLGSGGKGAVADRNASQQDRTPGIGTGFGSGGGGGWVRSGGLAPGRANPGIGARGFVSIDWDGDPNTDAQPNTGSGGGGAFPGNAGGQGGTGFVAISYLGSPQFSGGLVFQQSGYTIHEFRESGNLTYRNNVVQGIIYDGDGIYPGGTDIEGYIEGVGTGGVGITLADVYPVSSPSFILFLQNYGVWGSDPLISTFERTYVLQVPVKQRYVISSAVTGGGQVLIDGGVVIDMTPISYTKRWSSTVSTANKRLSVGRHTITIQVTGTSVPPAFGLTIAPENNPMALIFNSRNPPVAAGSAFGGNGSVILEFNKIDAAASIKINGAWQETINNYIKVDGQWQELIQGWVKLLNEPPKVIPETLPGQALFETPGVYEWTAPKGVDKVQVTVVGGGGFGGYVTNSAALSVTLNTPGTGTWTVPGGVTNVTVTCIGGGAAGSTGSEGDPYVSGGGGGGSGGITTATLTVTPGQQIPYTVGAGGPTTGRSSGAAVRRGAAGGNTVFGALTAPGGQGATSGQYPANHLPIGGVAGAGGGNGQNGVVLVTENGGPAPGGAGGSTVYGNGGTPGINYETIYDGSPGSGFGSGGGGGVGRGGGSPAQGSGGAGANGAIIINYAGIAPGGGGGGGALRRVNEYAVVPGATYALRVGGAGTVASPNGGLSAFSGVDTTAFLWAGGGVGANTSQGGAGGTGVTISGAIVGGDGGAGGDGTFIIASQNIDTINFEDATSFSTTNGVVVAPYTQFSRVQTMANPTSQSTVMVMGWGSVPYGSRVVTSSEPIVLADSDKLVYSINKGTNQDWGATPLEVETFNLEYSAKGATWTVIDQVKASDVNANQWTSRTVRVPEEAKVAEGVYLRFNSGLTTIPASTVPGPFATWAATNLVSYTKDTAGNGGCGGGGGAGGYSGNGGRGGSGVGSGSKGLVARWLVNLNPGVIYDTVYPVTSTQAVNTAYDYIPGTTIPAIKVGATGFGFSGIFQGYTGVALGSVPASKVGPSYVLAPQNSIYNTGTSVSFTIEGWFQTSYAGGPQVLLERFKDQRGWLIDMGTGTLRCLLSTEDRYSQGKWLQSKARLNDNKWHHFAFQRDGSSGLQTLYVDGVLQASVQNTVDADADVPISIGYLYNQRTVTNPQERAWQGLISNVRMVRGKTVYSGQSFVVPKATLKTIQPASTNIAALDGTETVLLTCQNNTFRDNSIYGVKLTPSGSARMQDPGPFSSQGLSYAVTPKATPKLFLTSTQGSNITIEAWIYATGNGSHPTYGGEIINKDAEYEVARMRDGRIATAIDWGIGGDEGLPGSGWLVPPVGVAVVPLFTPTHVAVVIENTTMRYYFNGNLVWERPGLNRSVRRDNTATFIGNRTSLNQQFDGFIGDVRLWNTARTQQQIQANLYSLVVPAEGGATGQGGAGGGGGGSSAFYVQGSGGGGVALGDPGTSGLGGAPGFGNSPPFAGGGGSGGDNGGRGRYEPPSTANKLGGGAGGRYGGGAGGQNVNIQGGLGGAGAVLITWPGKAAESLPATGNWFPIFGGPPISAEILSTNFGAPPVPPVPPPPAPPPSPPSYNPGDSGFGGDGGGDNSSGPGGCSDSSSCSAGDSGGSSSGSGDGADGGDGGGGDGE